MMEDKDKEEAPLEAEAARRQEWRGEADIDRRGSEGHTLPASEHGSASDEKPDWVLPGAFAPPD